MTYPCNPDTQRAEAAGGGFPTCIVTKQASSSKKRNKHFLQNQPKFLIELKRKKKIGSRKQEREGRWVRERQEKGGNDLASINISNNPLHFPFRGL